MFMCPPDYDHSVSVTAHALWHMMYGSSYTQVHELPQSHCGNNRKGEHIVFMIEYIVPILLL